MKKKTAQFLNIESYRSSGEAWTWSLGKTVNEMECGRAHWNKPNRAYEVGVRGKDLGRMHLSKKYWTLLEPKVGEMQMRSWSHWQDSTPGTPDDLLQVTLGDW